jgi:hypothetical protein
MRENGNFLRGAPIEKEEQKMIRNEQPSQLSTHRGDFAIGAT